MELFNEVVKVKRIRSGTVNNDGQEAIGLYQVAKFIGNSETLNNLIGNQQVLQMAKRLTFPLNTARRRKHEADYTPPQTRQAAQSMWLKLDL